MTYNVTMIAPGATSSTSRFIVADTFDNNGLLTIFSVHNTTQNQLNSVAAVPTADIISIIPVSPISVAVPVTT